MSTKIILNGSRSFISFTRILILFGTEFQSSCKSRQDEKGNNNPIRLPFESWCSLSVPQYAAAHTEN